MAPANGLRPSDLAQRPSWPRCRELGIGRTAVGAQSCLSVGRPAGRTAPGQLISSTIEPFAKVAEYGSGGGDAAGQSGGRGGGPGPGRGRPGGPGAGPGLVGAGAVVSELSLAHYRVLSAVAQGDERASHIARKLALGKPTVSAAVESLCQRGLLARTEVDGDQRAAALRLTPAGQALLAQVEAEMIGRIDDLCDRTPDGGQLIESLVWLGAAMDSRLGRPPGRQAEREPSDRTSASRPGLGPAAVGLHAPAPPRLHLSLLGAVLGSVCQTVVPLIERQIVDGVILDHTSPLWPWLVAAHRARRRRPSASPTCAATAAAGWPSRCSTTCATPCTTTSSPWTSPTSTGCRPASWSPGPTPTPPWSRGCSTSSRS